MSRQFLTIGTIGLLAGMVLFVFGALNAYLYAVSSPPGFGAIIWMMVFLFGGFLISLSSLSMCIEALGEDAVHHTIQRYEESDAAISD